MENFKEIAEKCLKGELSGNFIIYHQVFAKDDVKILKVPSKNLIIDSSLRDFPYLFKGNGVKGITCSYIANFNRYGVNRLQNYQIINFIPDMNNDKRTIQISLQQAREWYDSGNDTLKTLALSSFSKKEIDPYPRSWNEYLESHPGLLLSLIAPEPLCSKLMSYSKLLLLREEWIHIWSQEQGLKEDWKVEARESNHSIIHFPDAINCEVVYDYFAKKPLVFPDIHLANNFCNTFKSLLEKAKGLY